MEGKPEQLSHRTRAVRAREGQTETEGRRDKTAVAGCSELPVSAPWEKQVSGNSLHVSHSSLCWLSPAKHMCVCLLVWKHVTEDWTKLQQLLICLFCRVEFRTLTDRRRCLCSKKKQLRLVLCCLSSCINVSIVWAFKRCGSQ